MVFGLVGIQAYVGPALFGAEQKSEVHELLQLFC